VLLEPIGSAQYVDFHAAPARSFVRIVEAAGLSPSEEGREVSLEPVPVDDQLGNESAALALA
jgi:hypothetical protein